MKRFMVVFVVLGLFAAVPITHVQAGLGPPTPVPVCAHGKFKDEGFVRYVPLLLARYMLLHNLACPAPGFLPHGTPCDCSVE